MAESLAAPALKLFSSGLEQLKQERYLSKAARGELHKLKNLIEYIEKFLEEANSTETVDTNLREIKKQARRFIYDSEDVIDDYVRSEDILLEGLVARCYKQHCRRTFVSEARTLASEEREIREKIEKNREQIAMKTRDQSSTDHAQASSASHQSSSIAVCNETDDKLVGIEGPRDQLVQWLTDNNSMSKVIFVHGAQGVGKTSLVGAVLRDNKVKNYFKYYAWIKDYKLIKTKGKVQMQANVEMWDTKKENQRKQVQLEGAFQLKEALQLMEEDFGKKKKILLEDDSEDRWALVVDDVSEAQEIRLLQDHVDPTRQSVLITTRVSSLDTQAEMLVSTSRTSVDSLRAQSGGAPPEFFNNLYNLLNLKRGKGRAFCKPPRLYDFHNFKHFCLSQKDSLALFVQEMFPKASPSDHLTKVLESILVKCEGLPLAILAKCELLRTKGVGVNGNATIADWKTWNRRLGEELLSIENPGQLIRRMITLRMDQLRHAHDCLYYLSMFPLDCHIRCSTLMRLWMAERFAMQKGSKTDQTIAEENLKEILDHNLVQVERTSYGRVRICRLHSLLHEIIIKKSKDDEFAMIVANTTEVWPEIVWRLSFHSQMDPIQDRTRVNQLRSLLIFKEVYSKSMIRLLGQVDRLRVLHLEASSLNSFPKGIVNLVYLRYLKLRGSHVKEIPNAIGKLVHLETLDLKGTGVSELPPHIVALKALRHLLVYRSDESPTAGTIPKHGVKVPVKLGVLTSLQKLCFIKLDEDKPSKLSKFRPRRPVASLLEQLGELKYLQRLGISELKSSDMEPLCSSIEKLKELKTLHLIAASKEILDLSRSRAHPSLQRVHLTGGLGALPNWILSCEILTKLVLKARGDSQSQLEGDQLQQLGELPSLKHLELEQAFDAPDMTFEARKFQELRFLGLDRFDKLASLKVNEGALPTLEKLSLARCKSLTPKPQYIIRPRNLKCLELYGMPQQFMNAVGRDKEVLKCMKVVCKVWNKKTEVEAMKLPADRGKRPSAAPASTD